MAAPFNNVRSKLNRAIVAYLLTPGLNCGTSADIIPANNQILKNYPNTTVRATLARPEVPMTGLYRINVQIKIKGTATQPNGEPNPQFARVQFDERLAATQDAMMTTNDGQTLFLTASLIQAAGRALAVDASNGADAAQVQFAANNADMADFSVINVFDGGLGDGDPDADGCSWVEILIFEVLCCGSAVG